MKYFSAFLIILLVVNSSLAQKKQKAHTDKSLINWISLEEAEQRSKKNPRPILIDFYTDWCSWCKYMMKTTYSHPELAQYINSYFYPVKFNAETHDTIYFRGKKYFNESTTKKHAHQLTRKFLKNKIIYPSTVFINSNYQFVHPVGGYLDVKKIEPILIYTVENIYRNISLEDFKKDYKAAFIKENIRKKSSVHWLKPQQAEKAQLADKRKYFIYIHTDWCNGCKVTENITFKDTNFTNYLNKYFYSIKIDAQTRDTIVFGKKTYINKLPLNVFGFHPFVNEILQKIVILPTILILDKKQAVLTALQYYHKSESIKLIVRYFGSNAYITQKWEDFYKKMNAKNH